MIHAILYVIFILSFTAWLGYELKIKASLKTHLFWVGMAICSGLVASILSFRFSELVGNFLLHTIGGGVAGTFLFIYLLKTLDLRFNWRVQTIFLFAFVASLGVLNELAEYAAELLHLGTFSFDPHDTWRDLVANTLGSLLTWLVISTVVLKKSKQKQS